MRSTLTAPVERQTLTQRSERLAQLKRDIALHRYEVDAAEVAEAIVRKLRLVRRGLDALSASSEADRTRAGQPARRRVS
jgi:hypothetical protein